MNRWSTVFVVSAGSALAAAALFGLFGLATGCKADATVKPDAAGKLPQAEVFKAELEHVRSGWIAEIQKNPKTFQDLAKTSSGWAKYFNSELSGAAESFRDDIEELEDDATSGPKLRIGLGRTLLDVGDLFRRSGDLHVRLLQEYFDTRAKRRAADVGVQPSERLFHGISLVLLGDIDGGMKHLKAVIAKGAEAKPFLGQALAWKGFAEKADKDRKESWKLAIAEGEESADWVLYLKCRAGQAAGVPAGGSPMRDRLKASTLACMGKADEALAAAKSVAGKAPDQTDNIPALSGDKGAGTAELKYYSPVFLQEIGRAYLLQAAKTFEGLGGCASYWRGRSQQAMGDSAAAATYRGLVSAAAPVGEKPADLDFACTLFTAYQDLSDLKFDAERRADALDSKAGEQKTKDQANDQADDKRLVRRGWRLAAGVKADGGMAALKPLAEVPEDIDELTAALEQGLAEHGTADGRGLAAKVRAYALYGNGILRAKAAVAALVGEHPLALKLLQATHDNQKADRISAVNRPGYLLDLSLALWSVKQRRPAVVYMQELTRHFSELWQNVEFMNRVDAIFAVGGGDDPVIGQ